MKLGLYVLKFLAGIGTILLIAIGNSYIYAQGDMGDEEEDEGSSSYSSDTSPNQGPDSQQKAPLRGGSASIFHPLKKPPEL